MDENKEKDLRRLDELLTDLKNCDPKNHLEYTAKFNEYHSLFRKVFPECVQEYSLKTYPT